jgi:hypothetical protein
VSPGARTTALVVGGLMAAGGIALGVFAGGGWVLAGVGALVIASVLVERRYRGATGSGNWQRTGEREVDSETGEPIEVWFDPLTGKRRYLPLGFEPEDQRKA